MIIPESSCPFCALNDPETTVYSDPLVQAVVSKRPVNRFHVIVVPRVHAERLSELPAQTAAAAVHAAQRIGRAISFAAQPDGITYITEDDLTGQGYNLVAHWKLHIIARYSGDAVRLEWHREDDPGNAERAGIASAIRPHVLAAT